MTGNKNRRSFTTVAKLAAIAAVAASLIGVPLTAGAAGAATRPASTVTAAPASLASPFMDCPWDGLHW